MTKQIWKVKLTLNSMQKIKLPKDAEILTAQEQDQTLMLWALVNPNNEEETRNIEIFGTGHNVYFNTGTEREYITTVQIKTQGLVWHIYEKIN